MVDMWERNTGIRAVVVAMATTKPGVRGCDAAVSMCSMSSPFRIVRSVAQLRDARLPVSKKCALGATRRVRRRFVGAPATLMRCVTLATSHVLAGGEKTDTAAMDGAGSPGMDGFNACGT